MVQLHQCREQRMGVILMGPSGSGKTTLWRTLAAAYGRLGRAPVVFTLNPKAMPRKQLLGYMDADTRCDSCTAMPIEICSAWGFLTCTCCHWTRQRRLTPFMVLPLTVYLPCTILCIAFRITCPPHQVCAVMSAVRGCREWTDGVLTACIRKAAKEPLGQMVWIVCDGNIDPEWVEALNSVLDDNRLLTMPNGERVQLTPNVSFIFECDSLRFASPATVSRCAVIYTSGTHSGGWDGIAARVAAPLQRCDQAQHAHAWALDKLPHVLAWLLAHPGAAAVAAPAVAVAAAAAVALRGAGGSVSAGPAACRAIAASLRPNAGERAKFLAAAEEWCGEATIWGLQPGEDPLRALEALQPQDATGVGVQGSPCRPHVVPTRALQDYLAVAVPWFKEALPTLLVGPLGSGKRSLIEAALGQLPGTMRADVFCNVQTQAEDVINKLRQACFRLDC